MEAKHIDMREIKFRAKNMARNHKWAFGSLITYPDGCADIHGLDILRTGSGRIEFMQVKLETAGQFTGLKDKNGTEIYEGDVIQWDRDNRKYIVIFRSGMFYASVEGLNEESIHGGFPLWCLCEKEQNCEIIGNIYESPFNKTVK